MGHLSGDRAFAVHNRGDGVMRHMDMFGEPAGAHTKRLKIVAKKLAWMDWWEVIGWVWHLVDISWSHLRLAISGSR
jgi:hypothetical protein